MRFLYPLFALVILQGIVHSLQMLHLKSQLRRFAMSTNTQLTDLTDTVTAIEADEVASKAALATIIQDLTDLEGDVNSTVVLADVIGRLKAVHGKLADDTSSAVAADAAAHPTPTGPPTTPAPTV